MSGHRSHAGCMTLLRCFSGEAPDRGFNHPAFFRNALSEPLAGEYKAKMIDSLSWTRAANAFCLSRQQSWPLGVSPSGTAGLLPPWTPALPTQSRLLSASWPKSTGFGP